MRSFHGTRILITGASTGIGRALAVRLALEGADLCLSARRADQLEETACECRSRGVKVATFAGDLTEPAFCKDLVLGATTSLGGLDVLVLNAGVSMWSALEDVENLDLFDHLIRLNYLSAVWLCYAALPYLRQNRGMIVGLSSLAGRAGVPLRSGYSASKFAFTGFLEALRIEVKPDVHVMTVFPGMVATEGRSRGLGPDGKPMGRSPRDETTGSMPVERCVDLILKGMHRERREVVMTMQGKMGRWVQLIAPGLVDRLAERWVRTSPK